MIHGDFITGEVYEYVNEDGSDVSHLSRFVIVLSRADVAGPFTNYWIIDEKGTISWWGLSRQNRRLVE